MPPCCAMLEVISSDPEARQLAAKLNSLPPEVLSAYLPDLHRCGIAPAMLDEALKMLLLKAYVGDFKARVLCPEDEVAEVWWVLLLRPREYAAICAALTGGEMIGHNPSAAEEVEARSRRDSSLAFTRLLYAQVFGTSSRHFASNSCSCVPPPPPSPPLSPATPPLLAAVVAQRQCGIGGDHPHCCDGGAAEDRRGGDHQPGKAAALLRITATTASGRHYSTELVDDAVTMSLAEIYEVQTGEPVHKLSVEFPASAAVSRLA